MGIFCQISIEDPNSEFNPGSVVSGTIKYAFDKNTVVKRIIVSLKGSGNLKITEYSDSDSDSGSSRKSSTSSKSEEYVSVENVILDDVGGKSYQHGEYDIKFSYILPENIPGSLKYYKSGTSKEITCDIIYFINIKFEVPGFFKFNKNFKKEIKVVPFLKPTLSMEPVIYGERKKFFQPFKVKKDFINLKACIKCSVLEPGGKVEIAYEIQNSSSKIVEAVEAKLVATYKFYYSETNTEDVNNTESKTSAIQSGETVESPLEITIPTDLYCIQDSKLVSREYVVAITVILPLPHINMRLQIPIQVGKTSVICPVSNNGSTFDYESPPSYWEAMAVVGENDTSVDEFMDVKKF